MTRIDADLAINLGLCYDRATADAAVAAGGQDDYSVDEVLLGDFIPHDDAMFVVCREEVTPVKVLRDFATQVAGEALEIVRAGLPNHAPFRAAVEFLREGDADDRPEELAEQSDTLQRFFVSALVIEGKGDMGNPEKIAAYERTLAGAKSIRAALKPDAGEAAYAAAQHLYVAAKGEARDELGAKFRAQLARIFKAHS